MNSASASDVGFSPDPVFKGQIAVRVIEGFTSPQHDLDYMIDLDHGKISVSPNSGVSRETLSPGGRIDDCSFGRIVEIASPNSELAADCTVESTDGKSLGYHLKIHSRESNQEIREWAVEEEWDAKGIVWSPDSSSVAVLSEKERMDFGLLGLISMTSGHPIELETLRVTLLSVQSGHELKLPAVRKDSPVGWSRLDWIR